MDNFLFKYNEQSLYFEVYNNKSKAIMSLHKIRLDAKLPAANAHYQEMA